MTLVLENADRLMRRGLKLDRREENFERSEIDRNINVNVCIKRA